MNSRLRALGIIRDTAIMRGATTNLPEYTMSDQINQERDADGVADAIAVTAIIAVVVFSLYLWLSGMPT